jgi:hypothetical protein
MSGILTIIVVFSVAVLASLFAPLVDFLRLLAKESGMSYKGDVVWCGFLFKEENDFPVKRWYLAGVLLSIPSAVCVCLLLGFLTGAHDASLISSTALFLGGFGVCLYYVILAHCTAHHSLVDSGNPTVHNVVLNFVQILPVIATIVVLLNYYASD